MTLRLEINRKFDSTVNSWLTSNKADQSVVFPTKSESQEPAHK